MTTSSFNDSAGYLWTISNITRWLVDDSNETLGIDWDDWDVLLWTPEQRQLLERGEVPRQIHVALGVLLSFIVLFGFTANSTILYVFSRFKRLRTPANVFIINLTICDFFACCLHPLAVYSAFRGRWSLGQTGCNLYGMGVAFFGLNSIVTLSAIACERYIVITSSSCRPAVAKWRITCRQAQKACAGIWLHCAALVTPPWMLGWSSYEPEGVLVTCSWDYSTRTLSNRLYYVYLLLLGFVLPVSVLTFCYAAIFRFIFHSSKEMTRLVMASHVKSPFSTNSTSFRKRRRQTDVRTALIILSLAMLCYTAWTPYAIVSLIGQFGPVDEDGKPRKLSPMATAIPAFLAKTAIVFDPLVYGFSSPQFRSSVRQILNSGGLRGGQSNNAIAGLTRVQTNPNSGQLSRVNSVAVLSSNRFRMNKDPSVSVNKLVVGPELLQHQSIPLFQPVVGGQLRKSTKFNRHYLDENRRADSTDGPSQRMVSDHPVVPSHSASFPAEFTHPQSRLPKELENDPYNDTCF